MQNSSSENYLAALKLEIQQKAKNGVDFITAASILWFAISAIWLLEQSAYNKSIFTFMISGLMLPLAFGFSKIYATTWKIKGNPLQPLGMWINVAQLFYFPFLIFILLKSPDYFIMTFSIITGAHFLPYAWFYDELAYAIAAGFISIGSLIITLNIEIEQMWMVPFFTACLLTLLGIIIFIRWKKMMAHVSS
ncbi:MAG: hypothetical protein JJ895_09325 [Balneolaceae bacterium]|nr:hypothetical protein [Balneolaceae bacterium]